MGRAASIPLLCALFVFLWSSGFVGAKYSLDYAGSFTILFWRYLLVVAVLALLVSVTKSWRLLPRSELRRHMTVGLLAHTLWLVSIWFSIELGLSAGLAAFIAALQPLLTGLLSARMTGEAVSARAWLGLLLGLLAVALVIGDGIALGGPLLAFLLPFVAVFSITLASLIERNANVATRSPTPVLLVTFMHCAISWLAILPCAWIVEGFAAQWNGSLIFAIVWLGLLVSLGAYGLMFLLLRHLSAAGVASLTYLSPPVTMVAAWLAFGETLSGTALVGLGLAAIAVLLTLLPRKA